MLNCKRTAIFSAFLAVFLLAAVPMAQAKDSYGSQVVSKFGRGLGNTATGWAEVIKNPVNETRKSNIAWGLTKGLVVGVLHSVGRTVVGVVDLATFFIPTSEFVHPTLLWEPFEEDTSYGTK